MMATEYLGPSDAYRRRAELIGRKVTVSIPAGLGMRDVTGRVAEIQLINGGTAEVIYFEGRKRPLPLTSLELWP